MNKILGLALSVVLFAACNSDDSGAVADDESGLSFGVGALHYDCYALSGKPATPPEMLVIHALADGALTIEATGGSGHGTWHGNNYVVTDFVIDVAGGEWNGSASLSYGTGTGNGIIYNGATRCGFDFESTQF